jgi:NADPH:quinone reductase-like Zn-dependent oxidoreductase
MARPQNRAAVLHGPKIPFKVEDFQMPVAGYEEVVIKNHAIAINPVEWKVQNWGKWKTCPRKQRRE